MENSKKNYLSLDIVLSLFFEKYKDSQYILALKGLCYSQLLNIKETSKLNLYSEHDLYFKAVEYLDIVNLVSLLTKFFAQYDIKIGTINIKEDNKKFNLVARVGVINKFKLNNGALFNLIWDNLEIKELKHIYIFNNKEV